MLCTDGMVHPGVAPLRRLTRFEYNNTVRDLFGDSTNPASLLPAEEIGNGFGNDANGQSVSSLLAEEYGSVAEGIATRATATPALMAKLSPCAMNITATTPAATEDACVKTIVESLVPKLFRRALVAGESDALITMEKAVRATSGATFATGVQAVITAALQAPDFLYRVEWGVPDAAQPTLKRPSGEEMATRLSYLFWGTTPDDSLRAAAKTGELLTNSGVLAQATRMLDDQRSRPVIQFFFDMLLPINGLNDLERDKTLYPTYSSMIGTLMHQETQQFLDYTIFQGAGTWPAALTAPYTFVNEQLAGFYGMTGVTGTTFVKTNVDPTKRIGFITQGAVMAGTTPSNNTNPVRRGSFIVQKLLCNEIPLPSGDILAMVKPPDPYSAPTGRERYTKHKTQAVCATCHSQMDPVGFTLENYDAIGLWRTQENNVTIDASGSLPLTGDTVQNGVELVQKLAATTQAQFCFASHWLEFGYGKTLGTADNCAAAAVDVAFQKSGYNVKQLLLALTQSDEFLYYPGSP